MSEVSACASAPDPRFVGDPVDVVTGANVDRALDFLLDGTPQIAFYRHGHSGWAATDAGLGRGHRHSFDVRLLFDVDGMRLELPDGGVRTFPFLLVEGEEAIASGTRVCVVGGRYRVDGAGDTLWFRREPGARLVLDRIDARDGSLQLSYSGHQLRSIVASSGHVVELGWDAQGHLQRAEWTNAPDGRRHLLVRYQYEGELLRTGTDAYGHSFTLDYDERGYVARRTDRRGYSFEFTHDSEGRCVRTRGQDGVLDLTLAYYPLERRTLVTRADGGQSHYYYNDVGTLLQIIDPYGGVTVFVHDPATGRVIESVDPQGVRTHYAYDAWGKLRALRDEHGAERAVGEVARPRVNALPEDALGYSWGRLATRSTIRLPTALDWSPGMTEAGYGALVRAASPNVAGFQPRYDACHVLVASERADGARRRFAYDPVGNLRTYVDADGGVWRHEYASWNHRVRYLSPLGASTTYAHSAHEKLTELVDRGGTRSAYGYDLKDRMTEVRRHGRVRERYVYDTADRQIEKHDGSGRLLVASKRGPGGLVAERKLASGDVHKLKHDGRGLLLEAKNESGVCRFAYDHAERRCQDERDGLGVRHVFGLERVLETRVLGRFATRYRQVDEHTRLLIDPAGNVHRLSVLPHGVVVVRFAGGLVETSQYDAAGRCLLKVRERDDTERNRALPVWQVPPAPPAPWTRRFHYSAEGQLLQRSDSERGADVYTYDAGFQLREHVRAGSDAAPDTYRYDAAGNLLSMPGLSEGAALNAQGYATAGGGDVVLSTGNRLHRANGEAFRYDERDHVSERERWDGATTRYGYDSLERLVRVDAPGLTWQAKHDALGRRTEVTRGGRTHRLYWDTDRLAAEVFDDGRVRVYVYPDAHALVPLLSVDYGSLEAAPESGVVHAWFTNHLGVPEEVTTLDGAVVWRGRPQPFGTMDVLEGASFHQPLRWPGHYHDAATGLHYNRFREYDPRLGRYLQSDPQGISGGDNLYAYAWDDNPLRVVDVRGLGCPGEDGGAEEGEGAEGTKPKVRGVEEAKPEKVFKRVPGAHTLERHGGSVTDEQLQHRARTGVAPDGHCKKAPNGVAVIPPHATAFHSDQHALAADRAIRDSGALQRAIEQAEPGATFVTVPRTETGQDLGRGYSRIGSSSYNPDREGPLQRHSALTTVRGTYQKDSAGNYWPVTIFPEP